MKNGDYDTNEMSTCPQCGHQVPTLNLAIHQATACGRSMRNGSGESSRPSVETNTGQITTISERIQSDTIRDSMSPTENTQQVIDIDEDDNDDEVEIISAQHHQPPASSTEWTCPRCTLFNPLNAQRCEACDYAYSESTLPSTCIDPNENHMRPPDPVQYRQQLIHSYTNINNSERNNNALADPSNSMRYIGGGAVLGSLLGAAGAYIRGRNITNSIMEGAMTGVLGGVIARDVMSATTTPSATRLSQQGVLSNHESTDPNHSPRRIVSITRRRYPDGTVETICEENGVRVVQQSSATHPEEDPTMGIDPFSMAQNPLLNNNRSMNHLRGSTIMFPPPHHRFRVFTTSSGMAGNHLDAMNGMDYESLLEIFGDGSDHRRGVDEATMRRLPTTTFKNVEDELPNDREHRLCSICLEEFANGQTRKILPCLHGFHDTCIDRWLGANANCPICKHSLHE